MLQRLINKIFLILSSLASLPALSFATPLWTFSSQWLFNASLIDALTGPLIASKNTNDLSTCTGCVAQSSPPSIWPTTKADCETNRDTWVRGHDLTDPRTFSQNPPFHLRDIRLPVTKEFGTCSFYTDTVSPGDEDILTLAEMHAGILGPDRAAKQWFAPRRQPSLEGQ
ncbi:hypothetical protein N7G274_005687 [Stereocaulon virgatum]|uniref:Uncharacterized protein n=1 Tax=Stereocaulon virgatum TaxID=373712 RepID=A0ABR4A743_9LECA